VRVLEEVLGGRDLAQLAPQDRDAARRRHVGLRREEPEQPQQRDGRAVRPDALDRDVVHLHAAMHGRESIRLRDDEQRPAEQPLAQARLDLLDRNGRRVARTRVVGEDAEARPAHDGQPVVLEGVLAVAEEGEVSIGEPLEESARLLDLVVGIAGRGRLRGLDHR
jgi:hypothetical protein